jgi:transcriptional regulator with PAS, ATPase and Fis domain
MVEGGRVVSISDRVATRSVPVLVDPAMRRLYDVAARIARGTISVLVVGETGAGKEVLTEFVHARSLRASKPFVRINCAALSESLIESELFGHERGAFTGAAHDRAGLIEAADGGTVMLDEIGELSPAMQAKLLRVLEEGAVTRVGATSPRKLDVRFIAATNRDLAGDVEAKLFRRDLYFRIAGAVLAIPPLRERPAEIEALARAFLADAAARLGESRTLSPAAFDALRAHAWTGNVRELKSAIERAVLISGEVIAPDDLGLVATRPSATAPSLASELDALERHRIRDALARCNGNQTRAAALLGMPRRTFVKRLGQYRLRA